MFLNVDVIWRLQLSFFLAKLIIFCNDLNFAKALVGENVRQAGENEFRAVISIATIYNDTRPVEETHRCTGTLISRQDVLTSAHCLSTVAVEGFKLLVGSNDLRQALVYYCLWWWSYNYWATQRNIEMQFQQNDVAFLKILGDTPFGIPYARVPLQENARYYGEEVLTASWGITNNGQTSRMQQTARLRVITHEECGQRLTRFAGVRFRVNQRRLCTIAEPYVLLQWGDSGGPLLLNGAIIALNHGVCPQVPEAFHPDQVNLHFGLHYYRSFILDVRRNTQTHIVYPG